MGNPLFQQNKNAGNNPLGILGQLKSMGPSDAVFNRMYNSNPNFRQFADSVRGMSPEEAFRQNGLDFSQFRNMKW